METSDRLCQIFRSLGYKVTPQRRSIFQVLHGNTDHPSADDVYRLVQASVPDISLATVYNTLRELVDVGEVRELHLGECKSRYDPDMADHQHMVCVGCRTVVDVDYTVHSSDLPIEQWQGFRVLSADVTFQGVCSRCQSEKGIIPRRAALESESAALGSF